MGAEPETRAGRLVNRGGVEISSGRKVRHLGEAVCVVGRPWETSEGWRCAVEPVGRGLARNVFVDELEGAGEG